MSELETKPSTENALKAFATQPLKAAVENPHFAGAALPDTPGTV